MIQKKEKIKLIIQSLEKIYDLSKEDEIDMYKKLLQKDEEYCDKLMKEISKYINNEKTIKSELIVWLKKQENNFKEKAEKMIEQNQIKKLI